MQLLGARAGGWLAVGADCVDTCDIRFRSTTFHFVEHAKVTAGQDVFLVLFAESPVGSPPGFQCKGAASPHFFLATQSRGMLAQWLSLESNLFPTLPLLVASGPSDGDFEGDPVGTNTV